jgi:hypothetical protein
MGFRIWVETRLAGGIRARVSCPAGAATLTPEEIGLSLEEGKAVLRLRCRLAGSNRRPMYLDCAVARAAKRTEKSGPRR